MSTRKVLHLSKTPVAGAAGLISRIIDRYTSWDSNIFVERTRISAGDFGTDYQDMVPRDQLQGYIEEASLLHYHNCGPNDWNDVKVTHRRFVIHLHSEPSVKQGLVDKYPDKCVTLAQKHALLYKSLPYLPNMIPIYEPQYLPKFNKNRKSVHILYAPTSTVKLTNYSDTCMGKGYEETMAMLERIRQDYGNKVNIQTFSKTPKIKVLEAKQNCDIVIDEVVTGGYHLSSLEGLSMGCVTFCYLRDDVMRLVCNVSGSSISELPWVNCQVSDLEEKLRSYIDLKLEHPDKFLYLQKSSREWMENYWNPVNMANKFITFYNKLFNWDDNPWKGLSVSGDINEVRRLRSRIYRFYDTRESSKERSIRDYCNIHAGEPALIIGNGPSLAKLQLKEFIENCNPKILTCNFYFEGIDLKPNYWFCIDSTCLAETIQKIPVKTDIFINPPLKYIPIAHNRIWVSRLTKIFDKFFEFNYELERPFTVAIPMVLSAMYMGCNPIYIIGVDLSTKKNEDNYFYSANSSKRFNEKFRDFSNNFQAIIKQFKLMKEESRRLGVKIYNLDPKPVNFKVFSCIDQYKFIM